MVVRLSCRYTGEICLAKTEVTQGSEYTGGGARTVERVEVYPRCTTADEFGALVECVSRANLANRFVVLSDRIEQLDEFAWYGRAAHLGETLYLREICDWHDIRPTAPHD